MTNLARNEISFSQVQLLEVQYQGGRHLLGRQRVCIREQGVHLKQQTLAFSINLFTRLKSSGLANLFLGPTSNDVILEIKFPTHTFGLQIQTIACSHYPEV